MHCEQDLPPRRVRQRGEDSLQRFELLFGIAPGQAIGSTFKMVSSSMTAPIGSHMAMTSGV